MVEDKESIKAICLMIGQYVGLAGALDQMFQVIGSRVTYTTALWRQDGPFKDSGSCRDMDRYNSEMGITGIARDMLIQLREKRNLKVSGISTVSDCPYHRCDGGCVLEGLKSPRCLSHMEAPWELRRFGIDGNRLSEDIYCWLSQILVPNNLERAKVNRDFVTGKTRYIKGLTEEIKKFPYIGLPARPKFKRSFIKPIA